MIPAPAEVTQLLIAWRAGDESALDRLMPVLYEELHRIASRLLHGESHADTLQTTALIHEAYLRLVGADVLWEGRVHFLAIAARAMRRVLVDSARMRSRQKRGAGQAVAVTLSNELSAAGGQPDPLDVLALNHALEQLAALDQRKTHIVELHYFGGLSYDEIAAVTHISTATVHRELRFARSWLYRALKDGLSPGDLQPSSS